MVVVEAVDSPQQHTLLISLSQVLQQEEHFVLKIQTSGPAFTRNRIRFGIFLSPEWFLHLFWFSASFAVYLPWYPMAGRSTLQGAKHSPARGTCMCCSDGVLVQPRGCEQGPLWDLFRLCCVVGHTFWSCFHLQFLGLTLGQENIKLLKLQASIVLFMLEEWCSLHRQALCKISLRWLLAVEVNSCIKLEMLKGSPGREQCPCPAWQWALREGLLFLTGFCWGSMREWFGMGVWVPCSPWGARILGACCVVYPIPMVNNRQGPPVSIQIMLSNAVVLARCFWSCWKANVLGMGFWALLFCSPSLCLSLGLPPQPCPAPWTPWTGSKDELKLKNPWEWVGPGRPVWTWWESWRRSGSALILTLMWTGFDTLVLWQDLEGVWDISVYVWHMAMCGKVMDFLDHGTAGKKTTVGQMCPFWSGLKGLLSLKAGKLCLNAAVSGHEWSQNLRELLQCELRSPAQGLQRSH